MGINKRQNLHICPKCGVHLDYIQKAWCAKCMAKRQKMKEEFENSHTFYEPNEDLIYHIGYTDEITRDKGFQGKRFMFKRLDTGEVIESDNLWSRGRFSENVDNLPIIEFLIT